VLINLEIEPIVTVQAILGANPEIAFAVLENRKPCILGKTILNGEALKLNNTARCDIGVDIQRYFCGTRGGHTGKRGDEKNEDREDCNWGEMFHGGVGRERMTIKSFHFSIPVCKYDRISDIVRWTEEEIHVVSAEK
jgi:hypothetical protein